MTCQWCKRYRRRGGRPFCLMEDENGEVVAHLIVGRACDKFVPRVNCKTCSMFGKCTPKDIEENLLYNDVCPKWSLRKLSKWGGPRVRGPSKIPVWGDREEWLTEGV